MGRSGAVDFIVDLADAMATQQCEVEILVLKGGIRESRQPHKSVRVTTTVNDDAGRQQGATRLRRLRKLPAYLYLLKKLFTAARRTDIVMLTWEKGPALLLPGLVAAAIGKPTIAIVQNNVLQSFDDYHGSGWQRVMRWAYRRAYAVVCVSHDLIEVVRNAGVRNSRLQAIPNAIDLRRVRQMADAPAPQLPTADPYVIGVGRLARQKGFDLLIQAHASVVQRGIRHQLVLIGNGPDRQALELMAADLNVSDSVQFLGHLQNPYAALKGSSVCCLSSRYDGRALVLSEAAVLGVPIIATDCPAGARETLADGKYGELVENDSAMALANAIEKHLRDPQALLEKAGESEKDAHRFSIQTCAKSYIALISTCLNAGKPERHTGVQLVPVTRTVGPSEAEVLTPKGAEASAKIVAAPGPAQIRHAGGNNSR